MNCNVGYCMVTNVCLQGWSGVYRSHGGSEFYNPSSLYDPHIYPESYCGDPRTNQQTYQSGTKL